MLPSRRSRRGTSRHRPPPAHADDGSRRRPFTGVRILTVQHSLRRICCSASPPCSCWPASPWAGRAWTEISGAVIAPGKLVVDSNVKKVQHPTGGVVGDLRVKDGDRVKKGDVVVRLDETQARASSRHRHQGARRDGGAPGPARGRARRRRQGHLPGRARRPPQRSRSGPGDVERAAPVRDPALGARGPEGATRSSRSTSSASRTSATTSRWRPRPRRSTGSSRNWAASAPCGSRTWCRSAA